MIEIDILNPCPDWPENSEKTARDIIALAHDFLRLKAGGELSIVLADDDFVRDLNARYRGQDKPTNVLSFPQDDAELADPSKGFFYGDVILAYQTVRAEAQIQKKAFDDHFAHLVLHGFLHLLGHDHEDDVEAEDMEQLEIAILQRFGIKNPYEIKENVA